MGFKGLKAHDVKRPWVRYLQYLLVAGLFVVTMVVVYAAINQRYF